MHSPLPSTFNPDDAGQGGTVAQEGGAGSHAGSQTGSQTGTHAAGYGIQASGHGGDAPADSRIGALLQQAGKLSADGIERVLRTQQESGLRFGAAAMRLGLVEQEDVDAAIARQFAYPVAARGHSALAPQLVAAFHPAGDQGDT
jgi:hypothetical protein